MKLELKDIRDRIPYLSAVSELVLYIPFESSVENIPSLSPLDGAEELQEIVTSAIPADFFFLNKKNQIAGIHLLESNIRLSFGLVKELTSLENFEAVMNNFLVSIVKFFTNPDHEFKFKVTVSKTEITENLISFKVNEDQPIRGMLSSVDNNNKYLVDVHAMAGAEAFDQFLSLDHIKERIATYLTKKGKPIEVGSYIKEMATNLFVVDPYVVKQYDSYRFIEELDVADIVKVLSRYSDKYQEYVINHAVLLAKYVESGEEHVEDISRMMDNFATETSKVYRVFLSRLKPEELVD